jgi:hypothetical protein
MRDRRLSQGGAGRQGELSPHLTSTPLLLPLELLLQHCHSSSSVEDGDQRSFGACWSLLGFHAGGLGSMPVCDAGRLIPERFSGRVVSLLLLAPAVWRREGREGRPRARWRDVFVRGSGGDCGSLCSLCRSAC